PTGTLSRATPTSVAITASSDDRRAANSTCPSTTTASPTTTRVAPAVTRAQSNTECGEDLPPRSYCCQTSIAPTATTSTGTITCRPVAVATMKDSTAPAAPRTSSPIP